MQSSPLSLARCFALSMLAAAAFGCDRNEPDGSETTPAADAEPSPPAAPAAPVNSEDAVLAAEGAITNEGLMAHIRTLSADEFGGRAPMSEGERLTLDYLEGEFRKLGLEPMFTDSYRQPVALVSIEADSDTELTVTAPGGEARTFAFGGETVFGTSRVVEATGVEDSELVWAGYGIVAPEYDWNDYANLDVTGKTVIVLVNDPGFATGDPELFNGRKMTYYGRWTYKYEEAARQGADGVLIIHQTEPAAYGWNVVETGWSGPQFYLDAADGNMGSAKLDGWISYDTAKAIFAMAGRELDPLIAAAAEGPVIAEGLDLTATAPIRNTLERAESFNIGAVLPGTERPEEMFIYMAHWDHLGIAPHEPDEEGDFIYNGAVDNASGTGGLVELSKVFSTLPEAPERSVGFLAVTAEESGLLGSKAYAADPAWPMNQTVGGINMDSLNFLGQMSDIEVVGFGGSEMEDVLAEEAKHQNRTLTPEATPEKGFYYRSDHFNFAKRGVPILYADGGTVDRTHGADYVSQRKAEYIAERYHSPNDEIHDDWNVDAAVEDLRLFFRVGLHVADSDKWPAWYEGNEFRAIREASLAEKD